MLAICMVTLRSNFKPTSWLAKVDSCSSASEICSGVIVLNAVTWIDKAQEIVKPVSYILLYIYLIFVISLRISI